MTHNEPLHPLDVTFLLHAAELLPGDPQVDDYGTLYAAVARVNARALERDIYGSLYLQAGALLQTLARLPCLEHSNEAYAWHCAEAYLALNGCRLEYPPKEAVALVRDAASGAMGVGLLGRQLRVWSDS
ncbi:fic family toxin-antitoxin system, toxin component [Streptomyces anulatus]|uniref:fic family toxin-antitoxin system, toxin component n=1 Tax=Streptomyces TaxID=1883 RepID=UPI00067ACF74|nr:MULTISPECIES: fic family toxin-antitoxin system, toxin component [Streptomyces]KND38223.1 fic family toxin-antitoxin system, toxin component [Streptomyces europaeiscabiei]OKI75714.1 fic family toxin-antitoxin system, toxin component [Streptomyces sp. TSRI0395]WSR73695.1 fic family toxin-antitoxin system, toxin component [Streptomyces anulatus]WTC68803.1 fic family toxin-antitoxin system, toxin component [Streptomyces anulatus]WUC84551.1 fic family toxin-antitoxin system, toxin component [St